MSKLFFPVLLFTTLSCAIMSEDTSQLTTSITHYTRDIGGSKAALDFSYYQLDESNLEDVPVWLRRYYTKQPSADISLFHSNITNNLLSVLSLRGSTFINPKLEWSSKIIFNEINSNAYSRSSWLGTGLNYHIGNCHRFTLGFKYNYSYGLLSFPPAFPQDLTQNMQTLSFNIQLLINNRLRLQYKQLDMCYFSVHDDILYSTHKDEFYLQYFITPESYIKYIHWFDSFDIVLDGTETSDAYDMGRFRKLGLGYSFNDNLNIESDINLDGEFIGESKNDFSVTLNYRF